MTQEELDALMASDLDDESLQEESSKEPKDEPQSDEKTKDEQVNSQNSAMENYKLVANGSWPPPPPTEDHKMVKQLDDVTKDSEAKATQMFDKLEIISDFFATSEDLLGKILEGISFNAELFEKLHAKFPNVKTFAEALEKNNTLRNDIEDASGNLQNGQDEVMTIMDMMQYQDIHRQKIERVINVMRALSSYMNSLFEGSIDDAKRVSSAIHIEGDTHTQNVVSNDDIEALIESLSKK